MRKPLNGFGAQLGSFGGAKDENFLRVREKVAPSGRGTTFWGDLKFIFLFRPFKKMDPAQENKPQAAEDPIKAEKKAAKLASKA